MFFKQSLFVFVLAVLASFLQVQGQNWVSKCPERPVVKNFDVARYAGKWFDIYRYEDDVSFGCECVSVNFTPGETTMTKCCQRQTTGHYCVDGSAVVSYPNQEVTEGRMNISYFGPPTRSNYIILSTDYDSYSIVYNCEKHGENSKEWFYLLSRATTLSADVKDKVNELVDQYFDRKNSIFVVEEHGEKCGK